MSLLFSLLTLTGAIVCTLPIGLMVARVTMALENSELANKNKKKQKGRDCPRLGIHSAPLVCYKTS